MVQMGKFTEATRVVLADRDRKWNVSVTKMKKNQIDTKVERVERVEGVVEVEGDEQQKEEEEEETMTVKTPLLQLACKTSVGTLHEMTYNRLFLHPVPSDKKEEWLITVRFYFFLLFFFFLSSWLLFLNRALYESHSLSLMLFIFMLFLYSQGCKSS